MNQENKDKGSEHYKTGSVEPFDLLEAGGMLHDKLMADIIKYAFRNRRAVWEGIEYNKARKDMDKIIHCAEVFKSMIPDKPLRLEDKSGNDSWMNCELPKIPKI